MGSRSEPPCQTALILGRLLTGTGTEVGGHLAGSTMLSVVSSYIFGEEEKLGALTTSSRNEEDWVLVEKPEEEEQFFASSVAHTVPTIACNGSSSLSHTLTNSPTNNIGSSFLAHQAVSASSKAITTSTQTYKPRLAAFVPLFGNADVKKRVINNKEEEEVVVLAHYCDGQQIKVEKETYQPRSKALVPLFGNVEKQKVEKEEEEEVIVLAHYCNGQEIKLETEEESSKKSLDEDVVDEDVVLLAHYYKGQYIKQEAQSEAKSSICEKKNQEDDEVVLLAHFYNGQQIKQEPECDFQRFTSRQDALDFPCKEEQGEGEDDEVVVLAHYYNGHQMQGLAPVLEETPIDDDSEVVVVAHYHNGRQILKDSSSLRPSNETFIGPLEEEKEDGEDEVIVLAHYHDGQLQIEDSFIGPLREGESRRGLQPHQESFISPVENLSNTKCEEEVDNREELVVLAHYHQGQRLDRPSPPWSPARAINFSGKPLALTGPSKLALTYQEPATGIIDFLLDCLPFPDADEEEEEECAESKGGDDDSIPLPFSPNLAHTTDVTQVSLDLLSPRTSSPTQPFPTLSPSLAEEEEEEEEKYTFERRKRRGGRRCNHSMRQFPTFRSYFS